MLMFTVLYNNLPNKLKMQIFVTPPTNRPQRSLSYNDIKRKRWLHSQRSHHKLTPRQSQNSTIKKRSQSDIKLIVASIPKEESTIEGCIKELKGVLNNIRENSNKKRVLSIRGNISDRQTIKDEVQQQAKGNKLDCGNQGLDTKQLIKQLLDKKKSQRRLIRFNEIRDNLKKQKQRSKSIETEVQTQTAKIKKVKQCVSPVKGDTRTNKKQTSQQKDVKSTQPTLLISHQNQTKDMQKSLQELNACTGTIYKAVWQNEVKQKENIKNNDNSFVITDLSSIKEASQSDKFNQSQWKIMNQVDIQGSFLKLLVNEFGGKISNRNRQTRRRGQLQRVKRIFPAGFF